MRSPCGRIEDDGINAWGEGAGDDREMAPLRGSSTAAPGTRAAPHIASGPCVRGLGRTIEFIEYAGYAGVVGGEIMPPLLPIKASSVSPIGSILLSSAGGGMPALGGGAYVVRGVVEVAAVMLGGVYASLESGLELGATLPLVPRAMGEARAGG